MSESLPDLNFLHFSVLSKYLNYVKKKKINETTGDHFILSGHSQIDMKFTIIE